MKGLPTLMDERTQYDVDSVKDRLNRYREKERDIYTQIERLERLTAKMTSAGSPVLSDMPKAGGSSIDRMAIMVAEKAELEEEIREDIRSQAVAWDKIESVLKKLQHSDERAVIRIRYHDRESWYTVTRLMFGTNDDFRGKEESYLRRVHKIHGSALLNMAKLIVSDEQNPAITPPI